MYRLLREPGCGRTVAPVTPMSPSRHTSAAPPLQDLRRMELVHERPIAIIDDVGRAYDTLRVYAYPQPRGTWAAFVEFLPADGTAPVRSARETTQSSPDG